MMEASPRLDVAVGDDEPQDWKLDEVNMEAQQAYSNHHSMPTREEIITDSGGIRSSTKRIPKKLLIVVIAAIVVMVVAIPIAMFGAKGSETSKAASGGKSNADTIDKVDVDSTAKDADGDIDHTGTSVSENDANNDVDGSANDQESTTASSNGADQRMTTVEEIIDWMSNEDVSHRTDMETVGKAQHQAVEWLALYDPANLPLPATGRDDFGDGYRYVVRYVMAVNYFALVGNLWPQKFNFMSDLDVCEWNVRILIM